VDNKIKVAKMTEQELMQIKELESQLGNKYYIIAYEKKE